MAKKDVSERTIRSHVLLDAEEKKSLLGELKVLIAKDEARQGADDDWRFFLGVYAGRKGGEDQEGRTMLALEVF